MRVRVTRLGSGLMFSIASLISAGSVAAQAVDVDLGTTSLGIIRQLSPSRGFRPIDMIGARGGAEGWGMGGAYVAHADGIGAIPWNPAGLAWLRGSSVTADMRVLGSSGTTSSFPETFSIPRVPTLSVQKYDVNVKSSVRYGMLGAATSRDIGGRRIAGALSYRRYVDVAYPEEILEDLVQPGVTTYPVTIAFDNAENGGVDAAAASVGWEAIPNLLSFGMNLNFLMGNLRSNEKMMVAAGNQSGSGDIQSGLDYQGHSFDLGAQVQRAGFGAIGVRMTPSYSLKVRNGTFSSREIPTPGTTAYTYLHAKIAPYDIDVPPLLSFGGWFRILPRMSASFEWNHQNWGDATVKYTEGEPQEVLPWVDACGGQWEVLLDQAEGDVGQRRIGGGRAGALTNPLSLRNVSSWHVGLEARYLRLGSIALPIRLGFSTAPLSMAPLAVRTIDVPPEVLHRTPGHEDVYCPNQGETATQIALAVPADDDITSKAYTMGLGFETGNVRYDVSYEIQDYDLKKFYFDSPNDYFVNRGHSVVDVSRRITTMRISARLSL